jgi:hypothetical protein
MNNINPNIPVVEFLSEEWWEWEKYKVNIDLNEQKIYFYTYLSYGYSCLTPTTENGYIDFLGNLFRDFCSDFTKLKKSVQEKFLEKEYYTIGFGEDRNCDYSFRNHQSPLKISNLLRD